MLRPEHKGQLYQVLAPQTTPPTNQWSLFLVEFLSDQWVLLLRLYPLTPEDLVFHVDKCATIWLVLRVLGGKAKQKKFLPHSDSAINALVVASPVPWPSFSHPMTAMGYQSHCPMCTTSFILSIISISCRFCLSHGSRLYRDPPVSKLFSAHTLSIPSNRVKFPAPSLQDAFKWFRVLPQCYHCLTRSWNLSLRAFLCLVATSNFKPFGTLLQINLEP